MFYESGPDRTLQVVPIPWDKEARFRLPVRPGATLMDHYYPNSAWLRLRRDVFDRLADYKRRHGIPTWEEAIERLLRCDEPVAHRERDPVDAIARTLLYEGYLLYPYRPSALKNQHRFNFGVLYPASYCRAHARWQRCLAAADGMSAAGRPEAAWRLIVRFLQLVERQPAGLRRTPLAGSDRTRVPRRRPLDATSPFRLRG